MTVEYKCTDVYKKPENPTEWLPCPRCGLRPLVWEFDNGRFTACGCGTDCYSHWSVRAESIMSVIKRSDNGKSAEVYDIDELKNNWNHWVSRKHLQRYVDSSAFRYNTKHLSECERFDVLLQNIGHRLRYSQLKNMAA